MISLKNISMKPKLVALFSLSAIIPLTLVCFLSINLATKALMEKSYAQLETIRTIKGNQITSFFHECRGDVQVLAQNPFVLQAFKDLNAAFDADGGVKGGQFKGLNSQK